jgi:hypothetical protein
MSNFLLVNAPCLNKIKSQNPLTVRLPNGATMESTHTDVLNIPELNKAASISHVFPGMANHSLLSVVHVKLLPPPQPQLCAHGRTDKSKRPESHPSTDCARACVLCLKTEPKYYYCPITLVMK